MAPVRQPHRLFSRGASHIFGIFWMEVASGTYDTDTGHQKLLDQIAMPFNFGFSKEEGACASLFSRAFSHATYA